jgi:hypothetical protein
VSAEQDSGCGDVRRKHLLYPFRGRFRIGNRRGLLFRRWHIGPELDAGITFVIIFYIEFQNEIRIFLFRTQKRVDSGSAFSDEGITVNGKGCFAAAFNPTVLGFTVFRPSRTGLRRKQRNKPLFRSGNGGKQHKHA